MIDNEFYKKLNALCDNLDWEYDINSGACCYVAYLIASNLEKRHIPYNLVVYDYGFMQSKSYIKRNIKEHNTWFAKEGYHHYCIQLKDKQLLNSGEYEYYSYKSMALANIKASDIFFLYMKGCWNRRYDKRHNRKIKRIINNFFETI